MAIDRQYTPQQAAEILGVSDDGIVAMIHSGELVAVNVARAADSMRPRWRIAESDLGRFLIARRHPASMEPNATKPKRTRQAVGDFFS